MKHDFRQNEYPLKALPMTRAEMDGLGIEQLDFVYVIGDAYIDHPSFGPAIISRAVSYTHLTLPTKA